VGRSGATELRTAAEELARAERNLLRRWGQRLHAEHRTAAAAGSDVPRLRRLAPWAIATRAAWAAARCASKSAAVGGDGGPAKRRPGASAGGSVLRRRSSAFGGKTEGVSTQAGAS